MFRLQPFVSEKIWGYENWIVSTHPAGESLCLSTGTARPLKETLGKAYPLLIKVIQANETLSVQVHPDDEYARRENASGKTECWYVLSSAPGAKLVAGLTAASVDDVRDAIAQNRLEDYLHYEPVSRGDFIYIPSGLVHAIGGGIRLLEVQQSSDITYRLYDWGRERELHIAKALDVLRFERARVIHGFMGDFSCPYFELRRIDVDTERTLTCAKDTVLFVLEGSGTAAQADAQNAPVILQAEDTLFFDAQETITVQGTLSVVYILPC
jgi:mannose-6-phosphate isomerase